MSFDLQLRLVPLLAFLGPLLLHLLDETDKVSEQQRRHLEGGKVASPLDLVVGDDVPVLERRHGAGEADDLVRQDGAARGDRAGDPAGGEKKNKKDDYFMPNAGGFFLLQARAVKLLPSNILYFGVGYQLPKSIQFPSDSLCLYIN